MCREVTFSEGRGRDGNCDVEAECGIELLGCECSAAPGPLGSGRLPGIDLPAVFDCSALRDAFAAGSVGFSLVS